MMAVDDEPADLASLSDALSRRFGSDYRIVAERSARAALETISQLAKDGEDLALVIADQWMPDLTGSEFLSKVRTLMPMAKRALLVGWGDRTASPTILQGCALGQLDNYLYKPWAPAEVHLYPLVSEFLSEWTQLHRPPLELVHLVDVEGSARGGEISEMLARNGVPHGSHRPDSAEATRLLQDRGITLKALPALILLDGSCLRPHRRGDHGCPGGEPG